MSSISALTSVAGLAYDGDTAANLVLCTGGIAPALTISNIQLVTCNSTGGFTFPAGNTAQRPTSLVNGTVRFNTDYSNIEAYVNGAWANASSGSYSVNFLIVAGGGAGGGNGGNTNNISGGGGGGGGILSGSSGTAATVISGTSYTVTVGAGGAGSTTSAAAGGNSVFGSFGTAIGGGNGMGWPGSGSYYAANVI